MAHLYHHTLGAVERLFIDGTFGFTIEANLLESFTGQRLPKGEEGALATTKIIINKTKPSAGLEGPN